MEILFLLLFCRAKAGVFSGLSSKMTGLLSNAPSMPAMPAMPNISMPSMPNIPGLRKTQTTDEGAGGIANEALAASPDGLVLENQAAEATNDEDDRSRYIRYGFIHKLHELR